MKQTRHPPANALVLWGIHLRRDSWVSVRYAEELNSGESSATLWSTRPTWDFRTKVCAFSSVFVTMARRVCDVLPKRRGFPKAVCIVSSRPWSGEIAIQSPGGGKRRKATVG